MMGGKRKRDFGKLDWVGRVLGQAPFCQACRRIRIGIGDHFPPMSSHRESRNKRVPIPLNTKAPLQCNDPKMTQGGTCMQSLNPST